MPEPFFITSGSITNALGWVYSHPISFYPEKEEPTVNIYRGRIDHEHINPITLQSVRDFIIGVNNDVGVSWRAGHATVLINGVVYRVVKGSVYEKRDNSVDPLIYLAHAPGATRPDWLVGVLSALAQYYNIDQEPEIVNAIISIAVQASINQFSSVPGAYIAATFSGAEVTDVAIKKGSNLLAGLCPPETPGEPGVWRLRETGEVVTPDGEWVSFSVTGGL